MPAAPNATVTPPPTPTPPSPGIPAAPNAGETGYFDDRSDAQNLIRSYYNAINRKEYSRAWKYWDESSSVQPYETFKQGFADTASVEVTLGGVSTDAGMSQRWTTVPTALKVTHTDGRTEWFGGCYVTHLTVPEVQDNDKFKPMTIAKARMVSADSRDTALKVMRRPCE